MPIDPAVAPLSIAANPELTGRRRIAVLLSHGFTGSPASMRPAWRTFT
jgi:carboxylesterase